MPFDPTENRAARTLRRREDRVARDRGRAPAVGPAALDRAQPEPSEFRRGLRAGASQLEAAVEGGAGIVNTVIGDLEAAEQNKQAADAALVEAAQRGPSVTSLKEIESATDLGKFVAGTFGQVLPIAAPLVAGGPLGAGTRAITRAPISTRAATIAGAAGGSSAVESGLIFNELQGLDESDLSPIEKAATALTFGTAAGALDVLPVVQVFDKFGLGKAGRRALDRSITKDIAKGAGQSAVLEGSTEGLQTIIERSALKFANENFNVFSEEGRQEILDAMAAGAIVGAGFGGFGSGVANVVNRPNLVSTEGAPGDEVTSRGGRIFDSIETKLRDIEANEELLGAGVRGTARNIRERFFGLGRDDIVADIDAATPTAGTDSESNVKFARDISAYAPVLDILETLTPEDQAGVSSDTINNIASYINSPNDVGYDIIRAEAESLFGPDAKARLDQVKAQVADIEPRAREAFLRDAEDFRDIGLSRSEVVQSEVFRETDDDGAIGQVGFEIDRGKPVKYIHRGSEEGLELSGPQSFFTAATARTKVKELAGVDQVTLGEPVQESGGSRVFTIVPAREGIVDRNRSLGGTVIDPSLGQDAYVIREEATAVSEVAEAARQLTRADMQVATPEQIGKGNKIHRNKILRRFNPGVQIPDRRSHAEIEPGLFVNLPAMTRLMIQKRGSSSASNAEIGEAFVDGLVSLITDRNVSRNILRDIKPGTVLFYRGRNAVRKAQLQPQLEKGFARLENQPNLSRLNQDIIDEVRDVFEATEDFSEVVQSTESTLRESDFEPVAFTEKQDIAALQPEFENKTDRQLDQEERRRRESAAKRRASPHAREVVDLVTQVAHQLDLGQVEVADFLRAEEIIDGIADRAKAADMRKRLAANQIQGFHVGNTIFVNPTLTPTEQLSTAAHELGHLVYGSFFKRLDTGSPTYNAIMDEYIAWSNIAQDMNVAEALRTRGSALFEVNNALTLGKEGVTVMDLPAAERAYVLDFEEWFADQLGLYIRNENLEATTRGQKAIKTFAGRLKEALTKVLKKLSPQHARVTHRYFAALVMSRQSRAYRAQVNEVVKEIKFARTIKSAGARGKRIKNILLTHQMQQDPYSIESLSEVADFFAENLTADEKAVLNRALSRPTTRKKIEEITDSAMLPLDLYHAVAFQLWIDNKLFIGPQTETVFTKLLDALRKIFGIPSDDLQARAVLNAVARGAISSSHRTFNMDTVGRTPASKGSIARTIFDVADKTYPIIKSFFYTADSRMRENPVFANIMDRFHARVGMEGVERTYFEERTQMRGRFDDILQFILKPLDDADVEKVFNAAQSNYDMRKVRGKAQKDALKQLQGLFKEAQKYLVEAGVLSKETDATYFPRIYDYTYMRENKEDFIRMLNNKYLKKMKEYAHALHALEAKEYGAQHATSVKKLQATMAERVYNWIMQNDGNIETVISSGPEITVAAGFANQRKLDWLNDADIAPFMSKDFNFIMSSYIDKAVKTAAFRRRFGPGEVNQMIDRARKLGATDEQVEMAVDAVNAMLGRAGIKTNKKIHTMFGRVAPPGEVINPTLQKVMSAILVVRNMMVLGLATFTSLVDPLGILVRSGDMGIAWDAFKTGAGEIRQAVKNLGSEEKVQTEAKLLAQTLGLIDIYNTQAALEWEYGGTYLSGTMKKINEGFFKAIGLTQWTQLTRTMAATAGADFIKKHATGLYNEQSQRYLRQLNLVPQDIVLDENGDLVLLKHAQLLEASPAERARDARVKNAIVRFTDESILRPNAAQRPIWASDPHWMLVFHLQSFMYSFHDRILRRVYTEYADHKNVVPAMALMSFPLMMLAINDLRDEVKFLGEENPRKSNWGIHDHLFEAMDRSGIFGVGGSVIMSAKTDIDYGGFGFESRLGAVGAPAKNILRGRPLVNDIQHYLPLNSVWRHWDQ